MQAPNTKVEEVRDETVKKYPKPIITKWRVIVSFLLSLFLAWVPFFGYTYLIAYLQMLGFDSVDVNPKIYDLVVLFLEALSRPLLKGVAFIDSNMWLAVFKETLKYCWILFSLFIVFSILARFIQWRSRSKSQSTSTANNLIERYLETLLINSTKNIKALTITALSSVVITISSVAMWVFGALFLFAMAVVFWLLAMLGQMAGWDAGKEILKSSICSEGDWTEVEIDKGFVQHCAQIEIKGELVSGKRVFSDSQSTFFVTNQGSYQVSPGGEVLYFRPITRLDDTGNAKDD
jgi:hypothetical protein